jgi:hypothetical protein
MLQVCVFAIKNELFRLNNVYTDRIKIQGRQPQSSGALEQLVAVTLRSDEVVFEVTIDLPKDDGSSSCDKCAWRASKCLSRSTIPSPNTNWIWRPMIRTGWKQHGNMFIAMDALGSELPKCCQERR